MKQIFTLLVFVLTSLITRANHDNGRISITNLGNREISVEVDGKRYNDRNNTILIRSLSPGRHTIKVYRDNRKDVNSQLDMFGKKRQLIYNSTIYVKPQYHVDLVVNRFGKVLVDEQSMTDRNYDRDNDDIADYDHGHGSDTWNNRQMSDASFNSLKEVLQREAFDNNRMTMAKQSISNNYLSVDQVKQLVQLFTFDDKRLDLAKYAYRNTINKGDYFQLYEVFSFSSSKDALAEYVRNFK